MTSLLRSQFLLLFSLTIHGAAAGAVLWFSDQKSVPPPEEIYHVQLAELAPPPVPKPLPPVPQPRPETAEPPKPPPQHVEQPRVQKSEAKKINTKKQKKPEPKAPPPRPQERPAAEMAEPAPPAPGPTSQHYAASPPAPAQDASVLGNTVYQVDKVDQRPAIARRIAPQYPARARRMAVEGKVVVQLVVDREGQPGNIAIFSAEPPGYFEEAALSAARQMRFVPGKIKGQPVRTQVMLPFNFRLQ